MFLSKREKELQDKNLNLNAQVEVLQDENSSLYRKIRRMEREFDTNMEIVKVDKEEYAKALQAKHESTIENAIADKKKEWDKNMKEAEKLLTNAKTAADISEMEANVERSTIIRDAEQVAQDIVTKALKEAQGYIISSQGQINSMYETAIQQVLRISEQMGVGYPALVASMQNGSSAGTAEFIKNLTAIKDLVPTPAPVTINTTNSK